MTLTPEYLFYVLVIALIIVIVQFLYWWWRDSLITTTAMNIARQRLNELEIDERCPSDRMLVLLATSEFNDVAARNLIVASLYLLRSDFQLNHKFFYSLGEIPGFGSSNRLPPPPLQFDAIRNFVLKTASLQLKEKPKMIDHAVDRLIDNLTELEETTKRSRKIAA